METVAGLAILFLYLVCVVSLIYLVKKSFENNS